MTNLQVLVDKFFDFHFTERMLQGGLQLKQVEFIINNYALRKDFPLLPGNAIDYFEVMFAHHRTELRLGIKGHPKPAFLADILKFHPEKLI